MLGFALGRPWAWRGMLVCAVLGLWYLPFGTLLSIIQIILLLVEARMVPVELILEDPVAATWQVSHDLDFQYPLPLEDGGSATALEYVPFSSLTAGGGGGADFTSVGAIEAESAGA